MAERFSISSLAGTARTVVAVGTVSESSMLAATALAGPRKGTILSSTGSTFSAFDEVLGAGDAADFVGAAG